MEWYERVFYDEKAAELLKEKFMQAFGYEIFPKGRFIELDRKTYPYIFFVDRGELFGMHQDYTPYWRVYGPINTANDAQKFLRGEMDYLEMWDVPENILKEI